MPTWTKTALCIGVFLSLLTLTSCSKPLPPSQLLVDARQALRDSDFETVGELVAQIPPTAKEWQAGQLLAGEAAFKQERADVALAHYLDAAKKDHSTPDGQLALFSAAELSLQQGQLTRAEDLYRQILELQPENAVTHERMAFLLSITGRRWEALDHYFALIQGGDANYRELALAADVGRDVEEFDFIKTCFERAPDDELVRLAWAAHAFNEGEPEARNLIASLVDSDPELVSAQAMLGELLVDEPDKQQFLNWHQSLPKTAEDNPDIWFVRGLWAGKQSDTKTAADCFWQSVIRTPFHRRAFYMLGQVLVALDDPQAAEIVAYSERLIALSQSIDQVLISKGQNPKAFRATAELLEQLGRTWEVCAWGVVARQHFPGSAWPHELLARNSVKLSGQLAWIEPEKNPIANRAIDPVPAFDQLIGKVSRELPRDNNRIAARPQDESVIAFEEARVINFQYHNADDPQTKGVRTFEQTGGGVGILDFDLDGAPDVFLPQGTDWATGESRPSPSETYRDMLFRNLDGQAFQNASQHLSGADSGFGQGCAVGDYNNDGFPDLYVANVGPNALYENMGDGTFINVTDSAEVGKDSWTASAMICDLNADSLPDIFDVTYLMGEGIYTKICQERACAPSVFPGARDRLLINQGDGRFVEAEGATPEKDSKGLGIVAFEMETARRPVVFVANDQVANYFLKNEDFANPHNIRLTDEGLVRGLAFNEAGLPMACMGIAAEDWDHNGLMDLFVTNFHNEPNTYYLQDSPGLFVDATRSSGLYAASIPFTGWGTQSLDANFDGWSDLVLVNGHVDDYRDVGGPYRMRPQFFRNSQGRFEEMFSQEIGSWFALEYLGRGLARVDWNLDGLPEFIVSNMNAPVSVLKNTTKNPGRFLRFRLHATTTARDAIGARITVRAGDLKMTRQLMAGDGYMASNERIIEFGLGNIPRVDEAIVHWPSSAETILKAPSLDSTFVVVEDLPLATCLSSGEWSSFPAIVVKNDKR